MPPAAAADAAAAAVPQEKDMSARLVDVGPHVRRLCGVFDGVFVYGLARATLQSYRRAHCSLNSAELPFPEPLLSGHMKCRGTTSHRSAHGKRSGMIVQEHVRSTIFNSVWA